MIEKEVTELKNYKKFIDEKFAYAVPEFQEILDEVENKNLETQSLHFKNGKLFYE